MRYHAVMSKYLSDLPDRVNPFLEEGYKLMKAPTHEQGFWIAHLIKDSAQSALTEGEVKC